MGQHHTAVARSTRGRGVREVARSVGLAGRLCAVALGAAAGPRGVATGEQDELEVERGTVEVE